MKISKKIHPMVLASVILTLFLILISSTASAATYAYITNYKSNSVSEIDTTKNTVTSTISVGHFPSGVAFLPDGSKVYVTNEEGTVSEIDTATKKETTKITVGSNPIGIAINSAGTKAYVTNQASNDVSVIDIATKKETARVPVGQKPRGVAIVPDGSKVYVINNDDNTTSVIDTNSNSVAVTLNVGLKPIGVAVSPDGKVYVGNQVSNTVTVINSNTNEILTSVDVGAGPHGIAVTEDGKTVYVANYDSSSVSVIDANTNKVINTVDNVSYPWGIAVTPDGTKAFVTNTRDNTVTVIDTKSNTFIKVKVGNYPLAFGQFIVSLPEKENQQPLLPVADFSANPTSGPAPLSVQFTDSSQNAVSRTWSFGDGASSNEYSPLHIYSSEGTYTANLTVSNANGTSPIKSATITVQSTSSTNTESSSDSSSSSNGGGGGGGGGGSPEPQDNVQASEQSQTTATNGNEAKFEFRSSATCVVYVSFVAKKNLGKTTTIAEQLKGKSANVPDLPAGEVYNSFNVWVGSGGIANPKNIGNNILCFKVQKSWIQSKNIDPASILLNWYDDKNWEQLPVQVLSEDSNYQYFTSNVPGYSYFTITGKLKNVEQPASSNQPDNKIPGILDKKGSEDANPNINKIQSTKSTPGFEVLSGFAGLLGIFIYMRKIIR